MKVLFKNSTVYTKEKYNAFVEFHQNKYGKKFIINAILILIGIAYILLFNIINKNWLIILILVIVAMMIYLIKMKKTEKQAKKTKEMVNNQKKFIFYFYPNYIKIRCKRKMDILKYFELYKIFEKKEYFFLYTDETHSLILDKNGFEIGNAKEFSEFIKRKCPLKYKKEKDL